MRGPSSSSVLVAHRSGPSRTAAQTQRRRGCQRRAFEVSWVVISCQPCFSPATISLAGTRSRSVEGVKVEMGRAIVCIGFRRIRAMNVGT